MGRIQTRWGRATGPIGLDLGHHSIKLARIESDRQGRRVSAIARKATPRDLFDADGLLADPAALSSLLRPLLAELGLGGEDVIAAVSGPAVRVAHLTVSARAGDDLVPLVRAALNLPPDGSELALTVHPLGPAGDAAVEPDAAAGVKVMVCAMPQALLDGVLQALDGAGLAPLVVEACPLAAAHLAAEPLLGSGVLVGDLGASQATWTLLRGTVVERVVVTAAGGDTLTAALVAATGCEPLAAEQFKADQVSALALPDGAPPPAWVAQLDPYLQALVDGVAAFALAAGDEGEPAPLAWPFDVLRLHGAGALLPGLPARLQGLLGVPVELLDGLVRLGLQGEGWLPEAVWQEAPVFANALGLAWRAWAVED